MDILVPALTEREMRAMARRAVAHATQGSRDGGGVPATDGHSESIPDAAVQTRAPCDPSTRTPIDITPDMLAAAVKVYRYWAGKDAESVCQEILHHALLVAPVRAAPRTPVDFKVKVLRARAADLKHRDGPLNARAEMMADAEHMGEAANMLEYFARMLALTQDAFDRLDAQYIALEKRKP